MVGTSGSADERCGVLTNRGAVIELEAQRARQRPRIDSARFPKGFPAFRGRPSVPAILTIHFARRRDIDAIRTIPIKRRRCSIGSGRDHDDANPATAFEQPPRSPDETVHLAAALPINVGKARCVAHETATRSPSCYI